MASRNFFRAVAVVSFGLLFSFLARAQANNGQRGFDKWINHMPGYSARLSLDFCKKSFPHHKIISRPIVILGSSRSFELFTFTALPFDPKKPSIMTIHGGPGGLWELNSALALARSFPEFNLVFFHYRGGGCSDFRTNSEAWNEVLTSGAVIDDMEAIREAYRVPKWRGILGWSYGTNVARRYAHRYPDRVGLLVLEGLDDPYHVEVLPVAQEVQRLLSSIENRIRRSGNLAVYVKGMDVKFFLKVLKDYFSEIDPVTNFGYAAVWDQMKDVLEEPYKKAGRPVPKYLSLPTFEAVSMLTYVGEEEQADVAVLMLMDQFDVVHLDAQMRDSLISYLTAFDKRMFPFKYDDYAESFEAGGLLSWRVQLKMTENDQKLTPDSLCTSQPMIVLSGTKDLATPIENVERYLKDKSCAGGANASVVIGGGGHSSLGFVECLTPYVASALSAGRTAVVLPKNCSVPVKVNEASALFLSTASHRIGLRALSIN
jgi:pimeloyl-ACP methyl ester carboxylesterase